jgi:chromosome segregation ATPase
MFTFFRRVIGLFALVLGLVGVIVCGAGAYGVWQVQSRLNRANDKVFDGVDRGLESVQERIPAVRQRVQQAKITTDEVHAALRVWTTKQVQNQVRERIVAKLEIDTRAEQLAGHLHAVDLRLDASTMAVRDVRRLLELSQSLGADVDPASTDDVLELLTQLRGSLKEAEQTVDEVRRFTSPDSESPEDRLARVVKLLARVVATFADVESRLDRCAARLSELRENARQLHEKTTLRIWQGSLVCYGLLAWMAAAQAALGRWGFSRCFRGCSPDAPVAA